MVAQSGEPEGHAESMHFEVSNRGPTFCWGESLVAGGCP